MGDTVKVGVGVEVAVVEQYKLDRKKRVINTDHCKDI